MRLLRSRTQKAPVADMSASSSQASEDNIPPAEVNPKRNRYAQHYAAEKPDKPDAKMNGQYGMFSQCSPLLSQHGPSQVSAKRKRAPSNRKTSDGSKKKTAARMLATEKMPSRERPESPLFEPDNGWQEDTDDDITMLSPAPTPAFNSHPPIHNKSPDVTVPSPRGSSTKTPITVDSSPNSSNPNPNTSSPNQDPTPEIAQHIPSTASLPGDPSLTDEYLALLATLTSATTLIPTHDRVIAALANQEAAASLALDALATEQNQHLAAIARACAKGIQADMGDPDVAADMGSIQAAIEKRNGEAEAARGKVPGLMAERKGEMEARRLDLRCKREAKEEEWREEKRVEIDLLQGRRKVLEEKGGVAMGFELGRRSVEGGGGDK